MSKRESKLKKKLNDSWVKIISDKYDKGLTSVLNEKIRTNCRQEKH